MGNVHQPLIKGGRNFTYTGIKFSNHRSFPFFGSGPIPQTCSKFGFGSTNRTLTALFVGAKLSWHRVFPRLNIPKYTQCIEYKSVFRIPPTFNEGSTLSVTTLYLTKHLSQLIAVKRGIPNCATRSRLELWRTSSRRR